MPFLWIKGGISSQMPRYGDGISSLAFFSRDAEKTSRKCSENFEKCDVLGPFFLKDYSISANF